MLYQERKTRRRRVGSSWAPAIAIVQSSTIVRWHPAGFRLFWRWKSRPIGRPPLPKNLQTLILTMAGENPSWGEGRIACEHSLKLGLLAEACSSTTIHASMNIFAIGASTKWFTLWTDTPTIELKSRISQPANGNGKCADSNLRGTRNGFSRSLMPSRICSEWAATY